MQVDVEGVSFSVQDKKIISDIYFKAKHGQVVGLIGPNGSGKSTLLKSIYRVHQPNTGKITLDNEFLSDISAKKTAQKMAVVSQDSSGDFDFSVEEIVLMGRSPHKNMMESNTILDVKIARDALHEVGMSNYSDRSITTLSGGEKQRVLVARALAQQAKLLVLDEPTNHLDIHHQLQLMELVKLLNVTIVMALHDLNIASNYCDIIYVMNQGQIFTYGSPEEVLTESLLREVFRVNTSIIKHPITGNIHITFLSSIMQTSESNDD